MRLYAFLVLAISGWTIVSSEDVNGLDKNVFQELKDVPKATGSKEDAFVKTVWSELSRFFPESAKIPGVELSLKASTEADLVEKGITLPSTCKSEYWYNNYMCAFECKIYPKLAETVSIKVVTKVDDNPIKKKEGRVVVEVNAKFAMNQKSMDYNIFQKLGGSNDAKGPIPVSYMFNERSNIKLILDIPDASKLSTITDAECLVNIQTVEVTELGTPTLVNSLIRVEEEMPIILNYWDIMGVELHGMKSVMSIGNRRTINLKLRNEENYWICLSEGMKAQVENEEDQYKYSPMYDEFCKDAEIAD